MTVTLYTLPACSACALVKRQLDKNFIPYEVIDLSQDKSAYQFIRAQGFSEAPIIQVGDNIWSGYQPAKMKEFLSI